MAIPEQPGPAQLRGQRGSHILVTLGGVGQLKVELVPLAPCSRQREGGREQDRHCTRSPPSLQEQFPSTLRAVLTSRWDKIQVWPQTSPSGAASPPSTSAPLQSTTGGERRGKKHQKNQ